MKYYLHFHPVLWRLSLTNGTDVAYERIHFQESTGYWFLLLSQRIGDVQQTWEHRTVGRASHAGPGLPNQPITRTRRGVERGESRPILAFCLCAPKKSLGSRRCISVPAHNKPQTLPTAHGADINHDCSWPPPTPTSNPLLPPFPDHPPSPFPSALPRFSRGQKSRKRRTAIRFALRRLLRTLVMLPPMSSMGCAKTRFQPLGISCQWKFGSILHSWPQWSNRRTFRSFFPPVYDESCELGGAVLGRRLPSPDARLHEVALHKVRDRRPILHQHSRRGMRMMTSLTTTTFKSNTEGGRSGIF